MPTIVCTLQFAVYAFLAGWGNRCTSAFAPGCNSVRYGRRTLPCGATCSMSSKENDAAAKALEQAAKLRKEIADLEQDLARGTVCSQMSHDAIVGRKKVTSPLFRRSLNLLTVHTRHTATGYLPGNGTSIWYQVLVLSRKSYPSIWSRICAQQLNTLPAQATPPRYFATLAVHNLIHQRFRRLVLYDLASAAHNPRQSHEVWPKE